MVAHGGDLRTSRFPLTWQVPSQAVPPREQMIPCLSGRTSFQGAGAQPLPVHYRSAPRGAEVSKGVQ